MKIDQLGSFQAVDKLPGAPPKSVGRSFTEALKKSVLQVDQNLKTANQQTQDLAVGKTNRLHETMMSVEEADLSLKMLLQVRNKALEAYRELARMQL